MTRNKTPELKNRLASAKKKYRVAPRWVVIKKFGLKRGIHVSSWTMNPKMRRHWRKNKLKLN